jgi:hypothetical protein
MTFNAVDDATFRPDIERLAFPGNNPRESLDIELTKRSFARARNYDITVAHALWGMQIVGQNLSDVYTEDPDPSTPKMLEIERSFFGPSLDTTAAELLGWCARGDFKNCGSQEGSTGLLFSYLKSPQRRSSNSAARTVL